MAKSGRCSTSDGLTAVLRETKSPETRPTIGITVGDPAGIGPEVALDAARDPRVLAVCRPLLIGDASLLSACAHVTRRPAPTDLAIEHVPCRGDVTPGVVSAAAGQAAEAAIRRACELAIEGRIAAIATAPIHKVALRAAGVPHIGHTEILADAFGVADPLTMFVTEKMRIFFYSRHLSLRQAIDAITADGMDRFIRKVDEALKQLGIEAPRIGLAALNPHAGDGGQFGNEEAVSLIPAAERCRADGINVSDPIGADSVFHEALTGRWDGVVSLYHDQGHIAAKTRDFFGTVTATLGLPVLRTSVDHGTAFDIAWQRKADPISMIGAILLASETIALSAS
ncbi:MAG: 4-hydroxythreonine-4-phosphate dehydrogenase [Myxococcota bacterium]|jgi:4-hydroxythreonine-4-phosphate dehydrogenase